MQTDANGIYTDPKGDRFKLNRERSTSFYFFTRDGSPGQIPKYLKGRFTGDRFLQEAVSRHEHTGDMNAFSSQKEARDERNAEKDQAELSLETKEGEPLGEMGGIVEHTKEAETITVSAE